MSDADPKGVLVADFGHMSQDQFNCCIYYTMCEGKKKLLRYVVITYRMSGLGSL